MSSRSGPPVARKVYRSPVAVVDSASCAEYPAIAAGGAGWSRASRRAAAYGRSTDQRAQRATTCAVVATNAPSTATACASVRHPGPQRGGGECDAPARDADLGDDVIRAANIRRGGPGRVSRQSAPGPSRAKALTPKSSPAPEATRPGSSATMLQLSPDTAAAAPGMIPRAAMPRRSGGDRQTPAWSIRRLARRAARRGRPAPASRVSPRTWRSAGRRCSAPSSPTPASHAATGRRGQRCETAAQRPKPLPSAAEFPALTRKLVGEASRAVATRPVSATNAHRTGRGGDDQRTAQMPPQVVRTQLDHPAGGLRHDRAAYRSSARVRTRAAHRPRVGPSVQDVSASSVTAWTDHAMLSGAVTIAPRWSAAGRRGTPPPDRG